MPYVFGPVPSRRLGRSLGVDVVPYKTCTYDCVYCQIDRTTVHTAERKPFVKIDPIIAELRSKVASEPDYITISGSGEPTLFSELGELIRRIKEITDVPVAVLTNGSLLWREDVRADLQQADLVVPSLDAGSEEQWRFANRPVTGISFTQMLEGLIAFRQSFAGQYWLEVLLLAGHTDTQAEVEKLAACVARIQPDRVQLNTVTRPPADSVAQPVSKASMEAFADMFTPKAEVVADFRGVHETHEFKAGKAGVLETLKRRPCSVEDLCNGLGLHRNEVVKYLEELLAEDTVVQTLVGEKQYYQPK